MAGLESTEGVSVISTGDEAQAEVTPSEESPSGDSEPSDEVTLSEPTTETFTEVGSADQVIIEYLPKIYVTQLLLLGALIFGFIYKVIKNNFTSHFV